MTVPAAVYSLMFISFLRKAARKVTSPAIRVKVTGGKRMGVKLTGGKRMAKCSYGLADMAVMNGTDTEELLMDYLQRELTEQLTLNALQDSTR